MGAVSGATGVTAVLIGGVVKLLWWQAPGLKVGRAVKCAVRQAPRRTVCARRPVPALFSAVRSAPVVRPNASVLPCGPPMGRP